MSLFHKRIRSAVTALTAVCIAGLPMIASAAEPEPEVSHLSVRSADLDLATARGQAILQHRIRTAARRVCLADNPAISLLSDQMLACQAAAIESARESAQSLIRFAEASQAVSLEASAVPR